MSPPLRSWIVRRSHFPLALPGIRLGTVDAADRRQAEELAAAQFAGAVIVEPSHGTSAQLERALARVERTAARRATSGRHGFGARRGQPMTDPTKPHSTERTDR